MVSEVPVHRQGPGPVLRVTIELRNGEWSVIDRFHAPEMTIPPPDDFAALVGDRLVVGSWFEVLDGEGEVIYRKRMMAPRRGVEVAHPDGSMSRVDADRRLFSNDLLIPDVPEAEFVHLYVDRPVPRPGVEDDERPEPVAAFPARERPKRQRKGR